MDVTFYCTSCAKKYRVDEALVGRKVTCKACGNRMRVPSESEFAPPETLSPSPRSPTKVAATTPGADPETLELLEDEPPAAAKPAPRPTPAKTHPAARTQARANPPESARNTDRPRKKIIIPGEVDVGEYHLKEELEPWAHNAMKPGGPCPDCGQIAKAKTILCTGCGLNFKTGEKVPPPPTAAEDAALPAKRRFWPFRK